MQRYRFWDGLALSIDGEDSVKQIISEDEDRAKIEYKIYCFVIQ